MPVCKIFSSVKLDAQKQGEFLKEVEKVISEGLGKPVHYVLVTFIQAGWMRFSGGSDPAALAEISSIGGLNSGNKTKVVEALSALCEKHLNVPPGRLFTTFTDVPAANFAQGPNTFG